MAPNPARRIVNLPFVPSPSSSSSSSPRSPSMKRQPPPHIADRMHTLDGTDLAASLLVARSIILDGEWRSWMVKWFMRLHRHEVSRLLRQLGPMIPAAHTQQVAR